MLSHFALIKDLYRSSGCAYNKGEKIVEIEVNFFGILDWSQMKCFHNEIKRTPDTFSEMV